MASMNSMGRAVSPARLALCNAFAKACESEAGAVAQDPWVSYRPYFTSNHQTRLRSEWLAAGVDANDLFARGCATSIAPKVKNVAQITIDLKSDGEYKLGSTVGGSFDSSYFDLPGSRIAAEVEKLRLEIEEKLAILAGC
jgi:hypothetical protein